MVDLEIAGYEYSKKEDSKPSDVYIGRYQSSKDKPSRWNTSQEAYCSFDSKIAGVLYTNANFHVDFHTHLSRYPDQSKFNPSGLNDGKGDMGNKKSNSDKVNEFIILTRGHSPIPY